MTARISQLTKDILAATNLGFSNTEVADLLGCSAKQVDNAKQNQRRRKAKIQANANRRSYLRRKRAAGTLTPAETAELVELEAGRKPYIPRTTKPAPKATAQASEADSKYAALRKVEELLSEPEIEALQGVNIDAVHKQELPISMESAGKYTFFERVKILFRGWA